MKNFIIFKSKIYFITAFLTLVFSFASLPAIAKEKPVSPCHPGILKKGGVDAKIACNAARLEVKAKAVTAEKKVPNARAKAEKVKQKNALPVIQGGMKK